MLSDSPRTAKPQACYSQYLRGRHHHHLLLRGRHHDHLRLRSHDHLLLRSHDHLLLLRDHHHLGGGYWRFIVGLGNRMCQCAEQINDHQDKTDKKTARGTRTKP